MKFQSLRHTCGPAALSNAIEPFGIHRSEEELSLLCGTTSEGTTEVGIKKALKALDFSFTSLSERRYDIARLKLFEHLYHQATAVICVADNSHWVSVVGLSAQRFIVVDSADNRLVLFWDFEQLKEKWASGSNFYGVLIHG